VTRKKVAGSSPIDEDGHGDVHLIGVAIVERQYDAPPRGRLERAEPIHDLVQRKDSTS
jgi:hypothetical protein